MNGSGITLRGELVHVSQTGMVLRARGGQIIEIPASAVLRSSMEDGTAVVDLTPAAQLVVRSPEQDRFLSSDIFGRIGGGSTLDDDGGGGGGGGNCNCNCSGGNCNCNCNCSSIEQVSSITELPRLRRQLQ